MPNWTELLESTPQSKPRKTQAPEGTGISAFVISSEVSTSKSGNDMIVLKMRLTYPDGERHLVKNYLTFAPGFPGQQATQTVLRILPDAPADDATLEDLADLLLAKECTVSVSYREGSTYPDIEVTP